MKIPALLQVVLLSCFLCLSCTAGKQGRIYYSASLNGNLAGCDCAVPVAGLAKRAAYLRGREPQDALVLDGGNVFEAGPDQVLSRAILDVYKELSYDLILPGPQEFAEGPDALLAYREEFPFKALNLQLRGSGGAWVPFDPPEGPVFTRGGVTYRVLPLMGSDLFDRYPPEFRNRVRVDDPRTYLENRADRAEDCRVVMFHGSEKEARTLANRYGSYRDIFILAGEEALLEETLENGVLLVSPGEEGNRLGEITFSIRNGEIGKVVNNFHEFDYLLDPDDLKTEQAALDYKNLLDERLQRVSSLINGPVEFYYSSRCSSCEDLLPAIKSVDQALLLKIEEPENYEQLMLRAGERPIRDFPVLVWEDQIIQGLDHVKQFLRTGSIPEQNRNKRESSVLALSVFSAGLLDGINPCAFTTILFLISSLGISGASRRRQWRSGIVFSASVFLFYALVGAGFMRVVEQAVLFPLISLWGHRLLLGLLILFALLNLHDAFQFRKSDGRSLLQLPEKMKVRIRSAVRAFRRGSLSVGAAFSLGMMVSFFELGCTGQIYLPTIAYMVEKGQSGQGVFLLILYNLGFIIPLLGVLIIAMAGSGTDKIRRFFQDHLVPVKVAMSGLFFVFAYTLYFN